MKVLKLCACVCVIREHVWVEERMDGWMLGVQLCASMRSCVVELVSLCARVYV